MKSMVLFRTELTLWLRNFFSVFFALIFPVLMLAIFGNMFGEEPIPGSPLRMIDIIVPAYAIMIVGMTGLMSFPLDASENIGRHVYKRYDATPVGKGRVIGCDLIVNFLMTLAGIAVLLLCARIFFSLQVQGSFLPILGALALSTACMYSMGFLVVVACPDPKTSQVICYALYFVMLFLSGATIPSMLFPESLQRLSDFLPMTYAVDLTQNAFTGGSWGDSAADVAVLAVVTAACFILGVFFFRRRDWAK